MMTPDAAHATALTAWRKMSNLLFSALINLLGFVGLGAVGILPLRSWLELEASHETELGD